MVRSGRRDWVIAGTTAAGHDEFVDTALQPDSALLLLRLRVKTPEASLCLRSGRHEDVVRGPRPPAAPTNVSATTVASTSIRFTWSDNSDNEDGFRVYRWSVPDGKQWVVATTTAPDVTTFLDTGLQLSAEYFYFACAYNAAGETCATGAPGWLGATTTDGLPTAPRTVTGSPANTSAQVSWSAPTSDGGIAITTYVATSLPGGRTCSTSGLTTCGITGLTNGTAYTFTVVARNPRGDGPASTPSSAITPRTVPGAPTGVTGTPANNSVAVAWSAPASNGGSAVISYTAKVSPGGSTCTTSVLTCTIGGLINGAAYTFTVTATNVAGPGAASAASAAVTPRTVPTAPLTVTATRGTAQAHVSWAAPLSNGGNAIVGYTVTSSPGGKTCTSAGLSCWVTGLTNGTPYTFTVTATNNAGTGVPSTASTAVTPSAVVVRPTATVTPLCAVPVDDDSDGDLGRHTRARLP